jgi:hypothetical protein
MALHRLPVCFLILLLPVAALPALPQGAPPAPAADTAFVQAFYDWYTPRALAERRGPAWQAAVDERSADLDGVLLAALKDDLAAEAGAKDEIVGLDFDPFLNSQDPTDHYQAGPAIHRDAKSLVEVHEITAGRRSDAVAAVAVAALEGGRWRFIDFVYPGHGDLLGVLAALKAGRANGAR